MSPISLSNVAALLKVLSPGFVTWVVGQRLLDRHLARKAKESRAQIRAQVERARQFLSQEGLYTPESGEMFERESKKILEHATAEIDRITRLSTMGRLVRQFSRILTPSRMSQTPGHQLQKIAEFCFSKEDNERVLQPVLADMQHEYFDALMAHRPWKARWVHARGWIAFWMAVMQKTAAGPLLRGLWRAVGGARPNDD